MRHQYVLRTVYLKSAYRVRLKKKKIGTQLCICVYTIRVSKYTREYKSKQNEGYTKVTEKRRNINRCYRILYLGLNLCKYIQVIVTASVCIGCEANSTPARAANRIWSPTTASAIRVNRPLQTACNNTLPKWNQNRCSPKNQLFSLQLNKNTTSVKLRCLPYVQLYSSNDYMEIREEILFCGIFPLIFAKWTMCKAKGQ